MPTSDCFQGGGGCFMGGRLCRGNFAQRRFNLLAGQTKKISTVFKTWSSSASPLHDPQHGVRPHWSKRSNHSRRASKDVPTRNLSFLVNQAAGWILTAL